MKETRFSSKQLTELYDYISDVGPQADLQKVETMIRDIKEVIIEADDRKIKKTALKNNFPEAHELSKAQVDKLNNFLPWSTFISFSDCFQGAAWNEKKRISLHSIPDSHILQLEKWIDDKRVLEIGCHEGVYTLGLAKFAKTVTALDGRIENVIKTLTRVWLANKLNSVNVVCSDLENLNVPRLSNEDADGNVFDLIHHNGVLYHLSNPLAHLDNILENNPSSALFLDTHIADDEQCNDTYDHKGNIYRVYRYKEPVERFYAPFAGLTSQATWLRFDDLVGYLQSKGFEEFEEKKIRQERNGMRCRVLCSKK